MSVGGGRHRRQGFLTHSGAAVIELTGWRHLVTQLARAELRRENARLLLGSLWWVADPLLQMLVYTVLVSIVFARTVPDYPLFVLSALVPWKGVASMVGSGATAVIGNERIVRQVAFPRIVLPVARGIAQAWRLVFALAVMVILTFIFWPHRVSASLAWLPLLLVVQLVLTLPFAIGLSCATVFVRDLANLVRHALRLGLYLSPVLYSLDQALVRLPDAWADLYRLNPLAGLLEAYRQVTYEGTPPSVEYVLLPLGLGLVLLGPAMAWFHASEARFGKRL